MSKVKQFEIGPIRPPSEIDSFLLRITRNCPWNKCRFCTLYKSEQFNVRPIEEIKADIDQIASFRQDILDGIPESLDELSSGIAERYLYVMRWISRGGESVFLQDANTMVLSFEKLYEILVYLKEKLPGVKRVTTYGRVDSISKFTKKQLADLKEAGLNRIHSGYESGSDRVLALLNKGYTKEMEIDAGQKVKEAGIELSIYYMPGSGGIELSLDNAMETADVINKINPDFVRIRTFVAQKRTEIFDDIINNRFIECTDMEKMLELRKMIENVNVSDGVLYSDHVINLFENVTGNMGADKEKMLSIFDDFLSLNPYDQRRYQIARRMGLVSSPSQLATIRGKQAETIETSLSQLADEKEYEALLSKLLRRYI